MFFALEIRKIAYPVCPSLSTVGIEGVYIAQTCFLGEKCFYVLCAGLRNEPQYGKTNNLHNAKTKAQISCAATA